LVGLAAAGGFAAAGHPAGDGSGQREAQVGELVDDAVELGLGGGGDVDAGGLGSGCVTRNDALTVSSVPHNAIMAVANHRPLLRPRTAVRTPEGRVSGGLGLRQALVGRRRNVETNGYVSDGELTFLPRPSNSDFGYSR
jgi:hypothetical protein